MNQCFRQCLVHGKYHIQIHVLLNQLIMTHFMSFFFLVGFCFLSYPKYFFSFKRRSDPFTFIIVTAMFGLLLSRLILYLLFCMLFRDLLCFCLSGYELYFLSFYFLQSFKSYVLLLNSIGGYF